MKKVLVIMLVTVMLAVTSLAFAGGGQNTNTLHGDDGAGEAHSNHVSGMSDWG